MTAAPDKAAAASFGQRMARLIPYFGRARWLWLVVLLTTIIGSASEAAVPRLLNFLVTKGFGQHAFPLWIVPCLVIGLFAFRGLAGFMAQMALTRIANNGIEPGSRVSSEEIADLDLRAEIQRRQAQPRGAFEENLLVGLCGFNRILGNLWHLLTQP